MSDEWGPWIEHDGNGCPVPVGTVIEAYGHHLHWGNLVTMQKMITPEKFAMKSWTNRHPKHGLQLIRYRIRKPLGMELIEAALQGEPVKEDA